MDNILEVALRFLNAYCDGSIDGSLRDILPFLPKITIAACEVSAVYMGIIKNFIDPVSNNKCLVHCVDPRFMKSVSFAGTSLLNLLPTPNNQAKTFHNLLLCKMEYEVMDNNFIHAQNPSMQENS